MIPEAYYKDIYSIDYDSLKKNNINNLFFDFDNTIIPYTKDIVEKKEIDFINKLKEKGFNIFILSNSNSKRVNINAKKLGINSYVSSMKPLKKNYKKILKEYNKDECIFIGDQFMTDVLGAKRNDLKVILVDRISDKEPISTKFWRMLEKVLLHKYKKKKIFVKYRYYDKILSKK